MAKAPFMRGGRRASALLMLLLAAAGLAAAGGMRSPTGLTCELLSYPALTEINDPRPALGWIVPSRVQTGYQVIVSADSQPWWDSGRVESGQSTAVPYNGQALSPHSIYRWKVRTWDGAGEPSPWSEAQTIRTGDLVRSTRTTTDTYPLTQTLVAGQLRMRNLKGAEFFDFGKAAFGTIVFTADSDKPRRIKVRLSEKSWPLQLVPPLTLGNIRTRTIKVDLQAGEHDYRVVIPPDPTNTRPQAIHLPDPPGEVMPFRYAEIQAPKSVRITGVRQVRVHYPFDEHASSFKSSDDTLNDVWELCKYTIEATSFAGLYVDGDRERIPYEADAYINQLGHYGTDREYAMARATHEYLITHPTWPTEWAMHSVLMAWADYLYTGDARSLAEFYDDLKAKTLRDLEREDGLISTRTGRVTPEVLDALHLNGPGYSFGRQLDDLVDWPPGERDGFEFTDVNSVVNAFHYRALVLMGRMAEALGQDDDAAWFVDRAETVRSSFNRVFFDGDRALYLDGEGSDHVSIHGNLFALAMGLVPPKRRARVVDYLESRGMACSVYAAQHLLDGLYDAGADDYALHLMTATNTDRSWPHMIHDVGATITLEAWDRKYKPNLDWNHAWGAAPANIIVRKLMGIEPLEPGFARVRIIPRPGPLTWAQVTAPTIRGPVSLRYRRLADGTREYDLGLPGNLVCELHLPATGPDRVREDGRELSAGEGVKYLGQTDGRAVVELGSGEYHFTVAP